MEFTHDYKSYDKVGFFKDRCAESQWHRFVSWKSEQEVAARENGHEFVYYVKPTDDLIIAMVQALAAQQPDNTPAEGCPQSREQ